MQALSSVILRRTIRLLPPSSTSPCDAHQQRLQWPCNCSATAMGAAMARSQPPLMALPRIGCEQAPNALSIDLIACPGWRSSLRSVRILTIGLEPITPKEQILNLPCLPFHQVSLRRSVQSNLEVMQCLHGTSQRDRCCNWRGITCAG